MKVIIGAGPAGLYTAIKLRQRGIRDIIVYDPRAGDYTRPGHLNLIVLTKIEAVTAVRFSPKGSGIHIKDLERGLYKEARRLGITIENKRFLGLHQDAEHAGVVVSDAMGVEEIIEAEFVFDCTGGRRAVVADVNRLVPDSPLKLETFTKLPVPKRFIAYVKVDEEHWEKFNVVRSMIAAYSVDWINALSFAQSMMKLRALGWKEFTLPDCFGFNFGKNKVCLYLHSPENLSPEHHELWVKTVLECYVPNIRYEQLPSSRKPRFSPFTMGAEALKEVSYKGPHLPTVIALGDAQIDFDYTLGHGIKDGIERINALLDHMEIIDGEIYYFDAEEYLASMRTLITSHKEAVIHSAETLRQSFSAVLEPARLKLRDALMRASSVDRLSIESILEEIEARQSYERAIKKFVESHNQAQQLEVSLSNMRPLMEKLWHIHSELIKAMRGLPPSFETEHREIQKLLSHLADSWKVLGNMLFKNRCPVEAIDAYKKAMDIYDLPSFRGNHPLKELPLYSNLVIAYLRQKQYHEVIAAANIALSIFARCPMDSALSPLREKIVFNLIKAMCFQAQVFLSSHEHDGAQSLHQQVMGIMAEHEGALSPESNASISALVSELYHELVDRLAPDSSFSEPCLGSIAASTTVAPPPLTLSAELHVDPTSAPVVGVADEDARQQMGAVSHATVSTGLQKLGTFAPPPAKISTGARKRYPSCFIL
jgi:tetratricopeptide (TPR) repeat protein